MSAVGVLGIPFKQNDETVHNDLTHTLLGSCPIPPPRSLLNSSVKPESSWESRFIGVIMTEDLFFDPHFSWIHRSPLRQSTQRTVFYFNQAKIELFLRKQLLVIQGVSKTSI